jgi:mono/diheme cytochrome c family protein
MMRILFKWIFTGLGILLGLVVLFLAGAYFSTQARLERVYILSDETVNIPESPSHLEYGQHIFRFRGCEACHGEKLEGKVYLSDPALGEVVASNLTNGQGGVAGRYQKDSDWVNAIRHGVRPEGTPLLFMPSTEFYFLSDDDLGAVIAYIKSMPPVDSEVPSSQLSLTGRVAMTLVKELTFIPAEMIPHGAPRPAAPSPGITPEYGEYLTQSCKVCHGPGMSGGEIPAFPEAYPPAANLTTSPERYLPYWDEEGFVKIMRTGVTRHGREVNPAYMPWTSYKYMTDDELKAVWAYLQALPPRPYGNR